VCSTVIKVQGQGAFDSNKRSIHDCEGTSGDASKPEPSPNILHTGRLNYKENHVHCRQPYLLYKGPQKAAFSSEGKFTKATKKKTNIFWSVV
jgi:hypothetical protein